jgi:hypothetical protein
MGVNFARLSELLGKRDSDNRCTPGFVLSIMPGTQRPTRRPHARPTLFRLSAANKRSMEAYKTRPMSAA